MRRAFATAIVLAALAAAILPASGSAVTTVGSNLTNAPTAADFDCNAATQCTFGFSALADATRIAPGGLRAPDSGVVVRFRVVSANTAATPIKFRIIRPTNFGTSIGVSSSPALIPAIGLNTVDVRMPIIGGDTIGVDCCNNADAHQIWFSPAPAGTIQAGWGPVVGGPLLDGQDRGADGSSGTVVYKELLVNADIEADVDQDQFGDETQDACPGQTGTQGTCSNAFTIRSEAAKGGKLVLFANVPGAGSVTAGDATDKGVKATAAKKKKRPLLKARTITRPETTSAEEPLKMGLSKAGKKKLRDKGKLKLRVKVVFRPNGGTPAEQTIRVKLRK